MHKRPAKPKPGAPRASIKVRPGLHLHFEPATGIAGDMIVAALVDAGVPEAVVVDAVRSMNVPGLMVQFHREAPSARGIRFLVSWPDAHHSVPHLHHPAPPVAHAHQHRHRPFSEIRKLLLSSGLSEDARSLASKMFWRLARVEAKIHFQPVEQVTFHEVGGFDSIADIVGVAAAVAWLAPSSVSSSPPLLGSGTIQCAHGTIPVPAPATAGLLARLPVLKGGDGELTTPTGALVLTSLVDDFGAPPTMNVVSRGFGLGTKLLNGRPNALEVMLGEICRA